MHDVARNVLSDLEDIGRLKAALADDERIVSLRTEVERQARAQFDEGAITTPDYVEARTDIVEARLTLERHRVELAQARDVVVVGVRPVTDTVKELDGDRLGATVDRDGLVAVCSPIVLPAKVVAALDGLPTRDFVELVATLRSSYDVELEEAPAAARRVAGDEDIRVLEAMTTPLRPGEAPPRG